jgi:hypothetical protein
MAKSSTSFGKGNQAGAATRFAPGQSGNPERQFAPGRSGNAGGRPKHKPWADAWRKFGALPIKDLAPAETDTAIEACVKKAYLAMLEDPQSRLLREAGDRTDGRVPIPLVGSSDEPLAITIVSHIPRPDRSKKAEK